ncbi:hypothetical protein EXIGLDRAFT_59375 [Exidia glandulosa HHB12029]|uniref:Uncharacterized protein n=1 Tax=Exidia glandulosa HHB12029 TaxID=1314781 RepID=A0A165I5L7_EXIGL|nr:hypothetical protein EXIGLDRAFT_59375 [Exidia glandulosa HHB12029]
MHLAPTLYVHCNGNTCRWRCINRAILRLLSLPSMLPPELWLRIFEIAAEWDGHYVDIDFLRDDKRNRVLLACAHVCRRWLPLVLHVLYREIFIPGWDKFDDDRRLFSDTRTPLKSLGSTLLALTARGSNLPNIVQVLHVPIGYQKLQRRYDYCQNGDFGGVAEVVELCPSLRHLSLRVHCEPTGGAWSIPASALRSLATATHLEQITYEDHQDPTQMRALRYAFWADMRKRVVGIVPFAAVTPSPSLDALFQIIHVLPSVRYLEFKTSVADGVHSAEAVTLPNLREFRLRVTGRSCPSAATLHLLLDGAIATQAVTLSNAEADQISALPRSIATLFLRGPGVCVDLREFIALSHIGLEFLMNRSHDLLH